MERKTLFPILILILFSACEKIKKSDLEGSWYCHSESHSHEIIFSADSVIMVDNYSFKESGEYRIESDELIITRNSDKHEIRLTITAIDKDSITLFGNHKYYKNHFNEFYGDEYELIGVQTQELLSQAEEHFRFTPIQLYKSSDGIVKFRVGDKIAKYRDLPFFFPGYICSAGRPKSLEPYLISLFIGKGIKLVDLKVLYFHLHRHIQRHHILLVTQRKGNSDFYVFKDSFHIWDDELEGYLAGFYAPNSPPAFPPPPPSPPRMSKANYLKQGGKDIIIDSKADFNKIDNLSKKDISIITISEKIDLKDYIKLKEKLKRYRKKDGIKYMPVIN